MLARLAVEALLIGLTEAFHRGRGSCRGLGLGRNRTCKQQGNGGACDECLQHGRLRGQVGQGTRMSWLGCPVTSCQEEPHDDHHHYRF